MLRVAHMAAEAGLICVPHSANLSLVTVFTLHMMGAIPNAGPHIEFSIESMPADNLFTPALEVVDGRVQIPEAAARVDRLDEGVKDVLRRRK